MQEAESQTRALFRRGKRAGEAAPIEIAGQIKIPDLHGCEKRNQQIP